ncbi:MAG TPA: hypothetical protein DIT04_01545 [Dysgonomonas sp.]|nr:hypothetical protein [Dysgonomonas sp.]
MKYYIPLFILFFLSINPAGYAQEGNTGDEEETIEKENGYLVAQQAYSAYINYINDYLTYDNIDELTKYIIDNEDYLNKVVSDLSRYLYFLSPEQSQKIHELSVKLVEQTEALSGKDNQGGSDGDTSEDEQASITPEILDNYLNCLEGEVYKRLLPSNSLFYLSRYYIRTLRDSCAVKVSGYPEYKLKRSFDNSQNTRLQELSSMCESKMENLIEEKGLKRSPDAVINEIISHFEIMKTVDSKDQIRVHSQYVEFLGAFLLKEDKTFINLSDSQKESFFNSILMYVNKEDELERKEIGKKKYIYFETMDELISIGEAFYEEKLSLVETSQDLPEEERDRSIEINELLRYLSGIEDHEDFFIDRVKKEKLSGLIRQYDEKL